MLYRSATPCFHERKNQLQGLEVEQTRRDVEIHVEKDIRDIINKYSLQQSIFLIRLLHDQWLRLRTIEKLPVVYCPLIKLCNSFNPFDSILNDSLGFIANMWIKFPWHFPDISLTFPWLLVKNTLFHIFTISAKELSSLVIRKGGIW